MSKFRKQLVAGSIFLAAAGLAAPALAAVTVDFTFTSTFGQPGSITGKLVFLTTGAGVAASEIYVLTAPTGTVNDAMASVTPTVTASMGGAINATGSISVTAQANPGASADTAGASLGAVEVGASVSQASAMPTIRSSPR